MDDKTGCMEDEAKEADVMAEEEDENEELAKEGEEEEDIAGAGRAVERRGSCRMGSDRGASSSSSSLTAMCVETREAEG